MGGVVHLGAEIGGAEEQLIVEIGLGQEGPVSPLPDIPEAAAPARLRVEPELEVQSIIQRGAVDIIHITPVKAVLGENLRAGGSVLSGIIAGVFRPGGHRSVGQYIGIEGQGAGARVQTEGGAVKGQSGGIAGRIAQGVPDHQLTGGPDGDGGQVKGVDPAGLRPELGQVLRRVGQAGDVALHLTFGPGDGEEGCVALPAGGAGELGVCRLAQVLPGEAGNLAEAAALELENVEIPGADPCPGAGGYHSGQLLGAVSVVVGQGQPGGDDLRASIIGEAGVVGHPLPLAQEQAAPAGEGLIEPIEGDVPFGQVAQNADGRGLPHVRIVKRARYAVHIQVVRVGQVGGGQLRRVADIHPTVPGAAVPPEGDSTRGKVFAVQQIQRQNRGAVLVQLQSAGLIGRLVPHGEHPAPDEREGVPAVLGVDAQGRQAVAAQGENAPTAAEPQGVHRIEGVAGDILRVSLVINLRYFQLPPGLSAVRGDVDGRVNKKPLTEDAVVRVGEGGPLHVPLAVRVAVLRPGVAAIVSAVKVGVRIAHTGADTHHRPALAGHGKAHLDRGGIQIRQGLRLVAPAHVLLRPLGGRGQEGQQGSEVLLAGVAEVGQAVLRKDALGRLGAPVQLQQADPAPGHAAGVLVGQPQPQQAAGGVLRQIEGCAGGQVGVPVHRLDVQLIQRVAGLRAGALIQGAELHSVSHRVGGMGQGDEGVRIGEDQRLSVPQGGEGGAAPQGQLLTARHHGRRLPVHAALGGGQAHPEGIPGGEGPGTAAPAGGDCNAPQLSACAGGCLVGMEEKGGRAVPVQRDVQGLGGGALGGEEQVLRLQRVGRAVGEGQLHRGGHRAGEEGGAVPVGGVGFGGEGNGGAFHREGQRRGGFRHPGRIGGQHVAGGQQNHQGRRHQGGGGPLPPEGAPYPALHVVLPEGQGHPQGVGGGQREQGGGVMLPDILRAAAENCLIAGGLHVPAGEEPAQPQEGIKPVERQSQKGQHLDDVVSTADVGALMEQDIPPGVPAQAQGEVDFGWEEAQHKRGVHPVALPGTVRGADGGGQPPPQAQPGQQAPQPQRQYPQCPDGGQCGQPAGLRGRGRGGGLGNGGGLGAAVCLRGEGGRRLAAGRAGLIVPGLLGAVPDGLAAAHIAAREVCCLFLRRREEGEQAPAAGEGHRAHHAEQHHCPQQEHNGPGDPQRPHNSPDGHHCQGRYGGGQAHDQHRLEQGGQHGGKQVIHRQPPQSSAAAPLHPLGRAFSPAERRLQRRGGSRRRISPPPPRSRTAPPAPGAPGR